MSTAHVLGGVTVPLVTTLDDSGRPDAVAARPLLEALARARVHGLMLLGSNGEGALLPADSTAEFVAAVVEQWHALRPGGHVIVNVSAPGTVDMLRRAEFALRGRPDALVVTPPSYFTFRRDEVEAHIRAIERFEHPYAVYNVPKYATALTPETLGALLDSPWLVGMKDSSGDADAFAAFLAVVADRDDVAITQGSERDLLSALRAGASGIVPGVANIAPGAAVRLYELWSTDAAAAEAAQVVLAGLTRVHTIRPGVPAVKGILHDRGLIATPLPAPPLAALNRTELDALRATLDPDEAELIGTRRA
ncbi:dihydrodipicolinate synthase family protein [Agromyces laixinhei]|uniref:dihydrodipicolinate synthase family protein n=1 Tax=Agromyces laixinhei TaxID=2585717 RepID=UPI0018DCD1EA|nr:dihydrodipicolinate synthase family protein [Agromyces laixinhei]